MNFSKISIITPSYNQVSYLEETILSVLNQNYPNLEYIIIDGGSNDNSVEIIKKHESLLSYWISEKDKGQSHAINKGLRKATGEIVAWLNSDDMYLPEILQNVAALFEKHPEIDIVYGDVINFYPNGKEEYYHVKEFEPVDFLSRISIHQPAVFWRRSLHEEVGFLDENLHYVMDYDLWLRMFFNFKSLKVDKSLAKFRVHQYAKTSNNPKQMYLEYRKVISRFFYSINDKKIIFALKKLEVYDNPDDIGYDIIFDRKLLNKVLLRYLYNCAIQEFTFGSKSKAHHLFKEILFSSYFLKSLYFMMKNQIKKAT